MAADSFFELWRDAVASAFRYHKNFADRAASQVDFDALRRPLDEHTNSIAVNMKHVAGNLLSRWTDFLTTDGEKPWRRRDDEFVDSFASREELTAYWDRGWEAAFQTLVALGPEDALRSVTVRGEPLPVPMAVERSLGHACYHIGQIVILARHWAGERWETITIPRGQSASFNQEVWGGADYGQRAR